MIAALTAVITTAVSSRQVERDVTANAREIAIGQTVSAAFSIERAVPERRVSQETKTVARKYGLSLFVFSRDGALIAGGGGTTWRTVPEHDSALRSALEGRRFADSFGAATLVALPLRRTSEAAALVAFAPRPNAFGTSLSIFRSETIRAAIWAAAIAVALGLVIASFVARRLRRIAATARAIEHGAFDAELRPRFHDEIGALASAVDAMRRRLGDAFGRLEAERDRLELLLDRLHEGVIAVDGNLDVQYANASIRSRLPDLEQGTPLPESLDDLPLRTIAAQLFARGAPVAEARSDAADGTIYALVGIPAAGTELAVLVLADITADTRRRRAEREFVANASHELRTPVTAIAAAVDALELGAQEDPEARARFIRLIGRQAQRLTRLTRSLLVLARAQTREEGMPLAPVELAPLLDRLVAGEPSERVRVETVGMPVALAHAEMLEQVVANLLANAIRHAPDAEVVLRASANGGGHAIVEIADDGPGMPAEVRSRVFDRFYAGGGPGRDGFGLGLAIARDSTIAMQGTLEIVSEPGVGTTARVVLHRA